MMQPLFNGMMTILLAKFMINDLPHAAGLSNLKLYERREETPSMGKTTTVYFPLETQEAMSSLLQRERARTHMVEYGFGLYLRNSNLFPGPIKRGYKGQIGYPITDPAPGFFHTHPMDTYPPYFSETDTIDIFLLPSRRLSGVGHPDYSATKVSFLALTKAPPTDLIFDILDHLPGIYAEGVHIRELEEYHTVYEFTLGTQVLSMEVLLDWVPPKLPPKWWIPKETLEEFLQRKLPE